MARKLLEYGFAKRGGALMAPPFMAGHFPYPNDLNYTNHPYPMVWLFTGLFAIGGETLCVGYMILMRLAGALCVFLFLRRYFRSSSAMVGSLLYGLAPVALSSDFETNIIGIAASYWPFAVLLAVRVSEGTTRPLWLGLFIFFAAQTSWFFLTTTPCLALLASTPSKDYRSAARSFWSVGARAVWLGGIVAALVFFIQFLHYTADLSAALAYLKKQMGLQQAEIPRARMFIIVFLRNLLFVSPSLCIGLLLGLWLKISSERIEHLRRAFVVFLLGYGCVELVLLRFCYIEVSPYMYLLMPSAFLATLAVEQLAKRWLVATLIGMTIPATAYIYLRASSSGIPKATQALVPVITRHTQSDDVILTNLRCQFLPFQSWDVKSAGCLPIPADRFIAFNVNDEATEEIWASYLKRNYRNIVFIYNAEQPLSENLRARLKASQLFAQENLEIGSEVEPLAARVRIAIWKISGRNANRGDEHNAEAYKTRLDFYRFSVEP
ncbi:MAG: hypothetical protein WCO71_00850 [Pseudomonadota bacterium]